MQYNNIPKIGTWSESADRINLNFNKTAAELEKAKQASTHAKGLFDSLDALKKAIPSPQVGDWAVVGATIPGPIYKCATKGVWAATGQTGGSTSIELDGVIKCEEITDVNTIL